MSGFRGRDILSLAEFERDELLHVLSVARELEPLACVRKRSELLAGKILATAFFQPSTRTRLAHEAAMIRLGGSVLGFDDPKMTRAGDFHQESVEDLTRMLECYADAIVIRHFEEGAPSRAADCSQVPIINAGDGFWGEHPTQVLVDLYTVLGEKDTIDGLTFLCVGNQLRAFNSLAIALSRFDVRLIRVDPGPTVNERRPGLAPQEASDIRDVITEADVIYMLPTISGDYTTMHDAPAAEYEATPVQYKLTRELLAISAKSDAIVLHSLPRMDELPQDVDSMHHARYWQQASNGVVVRMAVLALVLGAIE